MSTYKNSFKQRVYIIIFGANTPAGKAFDVGLFIAILVSIGLAMMESVSNISARWHEELLIMEWIITILFTLEYALRVWTVQNKKQYIFSFFGLIDFFAILPTYLELFATGFTAFAVLRAVRLLRIFRVLRLVRFIGEARVLIDSFKASVNKITVFLSFVIISCTIIGTTMYLIEGSESGFTSIPRAVYWAVVTLTTVGYGDISPQTPLGQFLAMVLMILGYGVIAVPTGLVSADIIKSGMNTREHTDEPKLPNCAKCGTKVLSKNASYCASCGQPLIH